MKKNMRTIDGVAQVILSAAVAIFIPVGVVSGVPAAVPGIIAFVFIATSLIGLCPAHVPFKISTIGKK